MPGPEGLTVSVPHYDMTYQLNEIEVRSSSHGHAHGL